MFSLNTAQLLIALIFSATAAFSMVQPNNMPGDRMLHTEGEILVKIIEGASNDEIAAIESSIDAEVILAYTIVPGLRLYRINDETVAIHEAINAFMDTGIVEYAEPNYYHYAASVPNDPLFRQLWAMENTGQTGGLVDADINAASMWNFQTGSSNVVIAIVDTGMDYTHADLVANVWINVLEIPNNGIDDDNNGYIDDVHGINAILGTGNPMDDNDHGTHVSGIAGAKGNNGIGVVGVNQTVKLLPCKFLNAFGSGTNADAITCLQYLANLKTRLLDPVNIVTTNDSWGGGPASSALHDAIHAHQNLGILFVAAAGNAGTSNDTTAFYPASYTLTNVIAVAATDALDHLAFFSNFGRRTVHMGAPGYRILSTVLNQSYAFFSGTSMAAPHVSGMIGIVTAEFPTLDYRQIKNLIMASGTPISALQGNTISGRRLRGADTNGRGALTCSNQFVTTRLTPISSSPTIMIGNQLLLTAVNILCNEPAGQMTLYSDQNGSIVLRDNGTNGDAVANDGVYSLLWTPQFPGTYDLNYGGGDIVVVTVNTFATNEGVI